MEKDKTAQKNDELFGDVFDDEFEDDEVEDGDPEDEEDDDDLLGFSPEEDEDEEEEEDEGEDAGSPKEKKGEDADGDKKTPPQGNPPEQKPEDDAAEKAKNAEFARKRREAEEAERIAKAKEDAKVEAIIQAVGKNPYTNEEIKDAEDVAEYLAMKAIDSKGGDPIADYPKHLKEQKRVDKEKKVEEKHIEDNGPTEEWLANDNKEFAQKHPEVKKEDLKKLFAEPSFQKFAEGKVGKIPMATIYDDYHALMSDFEKKAEEKQKRSEANGKASPGPLAGGGNPEPKYYTNEQIKNMSPSEVRKNLTKIKESIRHNAQTKK